MIILFKLIIFLDILWPNNHLAPRSSHLIPTKRIWNIETAVKTEVLETDFFSLKPWSVCTIMRRKWHKISDQSIDCVL